MRVKAMKPSKPITLEKLDLELRAAGVEFVSLIQLPDGSLSLRDDQDREITDERVAAVVEKHVADPPRKRLARRVRELFDAERPAETATAAAKLTAVVKILTRFVAELEADDPGELPEPPKFELSDEFRIPRTDAELTPDEIKARDEQMQAVAALEVERNEAVGLVMMIRRVASARGVDDESLIAAVVSLAASVADTDAFATRAAEDG